LHRRGDRRRRRHRRTRLPPHARRLRPRLRRPRPPRPPDLRRSLPQRLAARSVTGSGPRIGAMTPEEVGERLAGLVGGEAGVSGGGSWARGTVDVPPGKWVDALRAARDRLRLDFFDWLSAVDELDDGF